MKDARRQMGKIIGPYRGPDARRLERAERIKMESQAICAESLTRDELVEQLANFRVDYEMTRERFVDMESLARCFGRIIADISGKKSNDARKAAKALHALNVLNGASFEERRISLINTWLSGSYKSRDLCAQQECSALGMSFSSARKALRNTPNPA